MVDFLARRIYEGKLEFEDVPSRFKEQVRVVLDKYNIDTRRLSMRSEPVAEQDDPEESEER
jgi:hypothetical protein